MYTLCISVQFYPRGGKGPHIVRHFVNDPEGTWKYIKRLLQVKEGRLMDEPMIEELSEPGLSVHRIGVDSQRTVRVQRVGIWLN